MLASDFILQTRAELQEKKEFWSASELLIKLQRSYISLQFDLPYFISSEEVSIKEGKSECYLKHKALKDIHLLIDRIKYDYVDLENIFKPSFFKIYSFNEDKLITNQTFTKEAIVKIVYKYEKKIVNDKCEIEIPSNWFKALRLLFMSEIHEKPTRNTKERNLSEYYLKKYDTEIRKLKTQQKARAKGLTSKYQRI